MPGRVRETSRDALQIGENAIAALVPQAGERLGKEMIVYHETGSHSAMPQRLRFSGVFARLSIVYGASTNTPDLILIKFDKNWSRLRDMPHFVRAYGLRAGALLAGRRAVE